MPDWLIALPVWGDRCRKTFAEMCWPSWRSALEPIRERARVMLFTDQPNFAGLFGDVAVELEPVPEFSGRNYHGAFSAAHRLAFAAAKPGEIVAIQNADHVLSSEAFVAAERRIAAGKKLVMCAGTRTVGPIFGNPPVLPAPGLLDWAMHYMHPIIQQCCWPHGQGAVPSVLYFSDGANTVMRGFHLHPFAVLNDRELAFKGTVDADLCDCFDAAEIHVVTDRDEMAMAEISPISKRFPLRPDAMSDEYLFWWGQRYATPMHWWFFAHRIVIQGSAATDCDAAATRLVMRHCEDRAAA